VSIGIKHRHEYHTLRLIAETEMVKFVGHPQGPDGAEWVNYMNTPNETHGLFTRKDRQCGVIPAHMECLFSKRYLQPEDYIIKV
jgi:hypothetical protein